MSANPPLNDAEMLAALDWYLKVGVDIAVGDEPVDRFALSRVPPRPLRAEPIPAVAASAAPAPPATPTVIESDPAEARALAAGAATLDELKSVLSAYDGCGLKARATQLVFADGNPEAEIMLVGEGPGGEEDRIGKPFVGRAGQLLDRMLASIGLDRTRVYIANTVPWRPPGNRNPTPEEIAVCLPFLIRQVELVAPRLLVTLGNVPTQTLFDTSIGITRTRGQWRDLTVGSHGLKAIATLHPAYLLRQPLQKHQAWRDMLAVKAMMGELGIKL
jgi:DNA polymerase